MVIDLYVNASDKEVLFKRLQNELELTGSIRGESNVINPSILIETTNPTQYNYCFIPEFNRYYYITEITSVRTNLWLMSLEVDVLMSFQSNIMNMYIIVAETEDTASETYMNGDAWKRLVKTKTDIINFPSGLNSNGEYILVTSGGIPS